MILFMGETLNIMPRMTTANAGRLRREDYIPGVLYGGGANQPVVFDKKSAESFVLHKGENAVFQVSLNGQIQPVRIREVQRHPVTGEIVHIDLQKVQMDKKVKATVPVRFEDREKISRLGYIINQQLNTVEVEGLPGSIPPHISIPLRALDGRRSIRVSDIEAAEELSIISDPSDIIATVTRASRTEETDEEDKGQPGQEQ